MRRIMTGLAIVWLATIGLMAALQTSQHAARAAVVMKTKGVTP